MLLVGAILLAVFVLPPPWGIVLVALAAVVEVAETWFLIRLSQRRRIQAGPETLIGARGVALGEIRPTGQVRVRGEIWAARSADPVSPGEAVRVTQRDGLTLAVEPVD